MSKEKAHYSFKSNTLLTIQNAQLALAMEKAELILRILPNPLMTRKHSTAFNDTTLKTALKERALHAAFLEYQD